MNKTMDADENVDFVLEDMLNQCKKDEEEMPLRKSGEKYNDILKMLTDSTVLEPCVKTLEKANQKLSDEIAAIEEDNKRKEEKNARDKAEAERNESLKAHLLQHLDGNFEPRPAKNDNIDVLKRELETMVESRKDALVKQVSLLKNIMSP